MIDHEWWYILMTVAYAALGWAIRIGMSIFVVMRRRAPSAALAWLLLIFAFPILGSLVYFLVGENRLGQKRRDHHVEAVRVIGESIPLRLESRPTPWTEMNPRFQPIAAIAEGLGACPVLANHDLTLHHETEGFIDNLVLDIQSAQAHCHLLFYIFNEDEVGHRVGRALKDAVARGVCCRLLVDSVGSKKFLRGSLGRELKEAGVEIAEALPANPLRARVARLDLRNHRKLVILDGHVAYAGSHNVSEPYYPGRKRRFGQWVDATIRLTGPVVHHLQTLFLQDWYAERHELPIDETTFPDRPLSPEATIAVQVLPTGPLSPDAPIQKVIIEALHAAREEAILTTPYFVPDEAIVSAIRSAAVRGVRVKLVVPKRSDNRISQMAGRSYYGALLESGVEVHEYEDGLLHAKTLTVDTDFALIGSANLDIRSFMLNFELGLLIYDDDFASALRFLQVQYMQASRSLTYGEWIRRGRVRRLADNIAKLVSPLL